jgi:hypothetical protein
MTMATTSAQSGSSSATSSVLSTKSSFSPASKVPEGYRRMDNFKDYETILRRTSEAEAFLCNVELGVSASASPAYYIIVLNDLTLL